MAQVPHGVVWASSPVMDLDEGRALSDEGVPLSILSGGPIDAPDEVLAGSMLGPVFVRPAPGKLYRCLRMLGPRCITRGCD